MAPGDNETLPADTSGVILDLTTAAQEVNVQANPAPAQQTIQMSRPALLNALRAMWGKGQIQAADLQKICMQLRIPVSYVLKGKVNANKIKALKKIAKESRRRNRYNGSTKGQTKQHYHKALGKV